MKKCYRGTLHIILFENNEVPSNVPCRFQNNCYTSMLYVYTKEVSLGQKTYFINKTARKRVM